MESPTTHHLHDLEAALDRFRAWLSQRQSAEFATATFDQLRDQLLDIQQEQDRRRTMMNLTRAGPFLLAMDSLDAALSAFVPTELVTKLMAYVWGPLCWLVRTASADDYAFDHLLDLLHQWGADLAILGEAETQRWLSPGSRGLLVDIYSDVLEVEQAVLSLFRRPCKSRIRQLHPGKGDEAEV